MSLWKKIFKEKNNGKSKITSEKQDEKNLEQAINEVVSACVVTKDWQGKESEKPMNLKKDIALEKENIASKKALSKKNEEKDVLHVKPLPVKFTEEEGIPKDVIATISACVAYLLAEEEELANISSKVILPIGRKAGRWSSMGRQELMFARQI